MTLIEVKEPRTTTKSVIEKRWQRREWRRNIKHRRPQQRKKDTNEDISDDDDCTFAPDFDPSSDRSSLKPRKIPKHYKLRRVESSP
jgi:hypothetical protein